jgi:hypothetical protein
MAVQQLSPLHVRPPEHDGFAETTWQTLLAPHVCGRVQLPHEAVRATPQLSVPVTLPQFLERRVQKVVFDSGVQADWPHTLAVPPPAQV